MIFPEIKYLYKYTSINDNSLGIFIKDEFWFAKPETFNDPLDCGIRLLNSISKEKFIKNIVATISGLKKQKKPGVRNPTLTSQIKRFEAVLKRVKKDEEFNEINLAAYAEFASDKYYQTIRNIGILSLSEVCDNVLMWSHYADQHRGFCIELERCKDSDLSNNEKTLPVRYSIKKPIISLDEQENASSEEKKEIRRSMIFTKSMDWSYEREWRSIQDKGNDLYKLNSKITAIIFGVKTPDHSVKTVHALLSKTNPDIKFKKARIKDFDFGIEVVDFNPITMSFIDPPENMKHIAPIKSVKKILIKSDNRPPNALPAPPLKQARKLTHANLNAESAGE